MKDILLLFFGFIGMGAIIQLNLLMMLRQWQAFKADKDPAEAFKITLPEFVQEKKLENEILKRG